MREIKDCAVEFGILDKINFDDLQEKRWLMNFSGFKKMKFNGLWESCAIKFNDLQEKSVVNLAFYKKAVNKF